MASDAERGSGRPALFRVRRKPNGRGWIVLLTLPVSLGWVGSQYSFERDTVEEQVALRLYWTWRWCWRGGRPRGQRRWTVQTLCAPRVEG